MSASFSCKARDAGEPEGEDHEQWTDGNHSPHSFSLHADDRRRQGHLAKAPPALQSAHEVEVAAEPKAAYDAFVQIGKLVEQQPFLLRRRQEYHDRAPSAAAAGAKRCRTAAFVRHMTVVHAASGEACWSFGRPRAAAVHGRRGFDDCKLRSTKDKATRVTVSYAVGGYDDKNFKDISKGVDGVIGEQFARYAKFASTGKP